MLIHAPSGLVPPLSTSPDPPHSAWLITICRAITSPAWCVSISTGWLVSRDNAEATRTAAARSGQATLYSISHLDEKTPPTLRLSRPGNADEVR